MMQTLASVLWRNRVTAQLKFRLDVHGGALGDVPFVQDRHFMMHWCLMALSCAWFLFNQVHHKNDI
jgi:hypothetical protein